MPVDLDDTSACPIASTCEVCGRGSHTLATGTVATPLGVACVTLCTGCAHAGRLGRWSPHTAAIRAGLHCEHLGIDFDEMATALDRAR